MPQFSPAVIPIPATGDAHDEDYQDKDIRLGNQQPAARGLCQRDRYWGITSVTKTTTQFAALGVAIRNHVEANMYNDLTREDIYAICTKKGQDQQDAVANLIAHSKLLDERTTAARAAVMDPALQATLDGESHMEQEYLNAGAALSKAIVNDPPSLKLRPDRPFNSTQDFSRNSRIAATSWRKGRNKLNSARPKKRPEPRAPCF